MNNRLWMAAVLLASGLSFVAGAWLVSAPPAAPASGVHGHAESNAWTCSMHPQVQQPDPGRCPLCGMELIQAATENTASANNVVRLSDRAQTLGRIRTVAVETSTTSETERHLLGRVDYDETTLRAVTAWVGGRIDSLAVNSTGERVRAGQAIATLYSPEVYSAHQDLIQARQQLQRFGAGATAGARMAAEAALRAARDRLRLLGVPGGELAAMEKDTRPSEQIAIRSPFGGTVIERMASEGSYVSTGTGLYRIADLRRVWVQLDAYESDLPLLKRGNTVTLRVEALPGEEFRGRVTFVDPVLNQRTRTARVRIEVANRDRRLSPGMFAEAIVRSSTAASESALVIPASAPLFTGRRSLVYVERQTAEGAAYEARVVQLGPQRGDVYPVLAGLTAGERVVAHGAFAIDADLQIRGGASMISIEDDSAPTITLTAEQKLQLAPVLQAYLSIHEALAGDDLRAARVASRNLVTTATAVEAGAPGDFRQAWLPVARQMAVQGERLGQAEAFPSARASFKDLSQQIATVLRVFGNPIDATVHLAFCPMALGNVGAEWVQRSSSIENPYFGASMHSCGEVHQAVMHGSFLPGSQQAEPLAKPKRGHPH